MHGLPLLAGCSHFFGTNPIAFGWPREEKPPFIFDMATSAAARGEIQLHQRAGKAVPEGWGIDGDGQATTDAQAILDGAMLTFGGHKGSALAAMVELLAGPLIGDMTSAESLAWDNGAGGLPYGGELILALDPVRFLERAPRNIWRVPRCSLPGCSGKGRVCRGASLPFPYAYNSRRCGNRPFTFQGYICVSEIIIAITGGIMSLLLYVFRYVFLFHTVFCA